MAQTDDDLTALRQQIDAVDDQLMALLQERFTLVDAVGTYKRSHHVPVVQKARMAALKRRLVARHGTRILTEQFINDLYQVITDHAIELEKEQPHD